MLIQYSMVTGGLQILQKQRRHPNLQQPARVVDAVGYSESLVDKEMLKRLLRRLMPLSC